MTTESVWFELWTMTTSGFLSKLKSPMPWVPPCTAVAPAASGAPGYPPSPVMANPTERSQIFVPFPR